MKVLRKILLQVMMILGVWGCVPGDDFGVLGECDALPGSLVSVSAISREFNTEPVMVSTEKVIRLYVSSDDRESNVYGAIYLQDAPENPETGVELRTDLRNAYLKYPQGAEVFLNLKGLFVRSIGGALQVGSKQNSFGVTSLARIPEQVTEKHLVRSCTPPVKMHPKVVRPDSLNAHWQFLYVRLEGLEVAPSDLCKTFADIEENTIRKLEGCGNSGLELLTSGYSDFQNLSLPEGMGSATGVLKFRGNKPQLLINKAEDLVFDHDRCNGYALNCSPPVPNSSIAEIKNLYTEGSMTGVLDGRVLGAVIIADDRSEHFKGELYIRDSSGAIRLQTGKKELYKDGYISGSRIVVDLSGLVVVRDRGEFVLAFPGDTSWQPIPGDLFPYFIYAADEPAGEVEPQLHSLADINEAMIGELITLEDVQFVGSGIFMEGLCYRLLTDCYGNSLSVVVPENLLPGDTEPESGSTTGILTFKDGYLLKPISPNDYFKPKGDFCLYFSGSERVPAIEIAQMSIDAPGIIMDNIVVEGVVISDVEFGNFPNNEIFIQCETGSLSVKLTGMHQISRGSRVRVALMGGQLLHHAGIPAVEGLLPLQIVLLESGVLPGPMEISVQELINNDHAGQWLNLNSVSLVGDAGTISDGTRVGDCFDSVALRVLQESALNGYIAGSGSGAISGFYYDGYFVVGRPSDIGFNEEALQCSGLDEGHGVIISEIADPLNSSSDLNSRYIELYNNSEMGIDLSGWELRRYTNGNQVYTESTVITFNNIHLEGKAVLVIAANAMDFEEVYGFPPAMQGGSSSAADSNGDDNVILVGPSGELMDVFGVPGEDGTGTSHDFQDGRAVRKTGIIMGSRLFNAQQWEVFNGHGEQGTHKQLLTAPQDFDPGTHH